MQRSSKGQDYHGIMYPCKQGTKPSNLPIHHDVQSSSAYTLSQNALFTSLLKSVMAVVNGPGPYWNYNYHNSATANTINPHEAQSLTYWFNTGKVLHPTPPVIRVSTSNQKSKQLIRYSSAHRVSLITPFASSHVLRLFLPFDPRN